MKIENDYFSATCRNSHSHSPQTMLYFAGQWGDFQKLSQGFVTLGMTSEGLEEMFEGDFEDSSAGVDGGPS